MSKCVRACVRVNEEGKNQANHNNLEKKREKKVSVRCKNENGKLTAMK